eukprot:TRINITY_DN11680_c0_g2_i22.p2 TRINITY_DN11680_c0_g2~~TRINITY_DN11680_c0_g2_i22.p2  ORF type:complete len:185 (+),score=54.63 TRINITY_DN11680_c0_g2_i22:80-556(+)
MCIRDSSEIDFVIRNPIRKEVFRRRGKREGIFYFDAVDKGTYQFVFSNSKFLENKKVTFALHCGNSTDSVLVASDLDPLDVRLQGIDRTLKDIHVETKFSSMRQETHFKTVKSAHNKLYVLTLFEFVGIIGTTVWQIYYIKRLLDNRRIIQPTRKRSE